MESAHCAFISVSCLPSGTHAPFSEHNAKILASSLKVRRARVDSLVTGRAFIVTNLKRRPLSFATLYPEAVTQFLQAALVDLQQIREGQRECHIQIQLVLIGGIEGQTVGGRLRMMSQAVPQEWVAKWNKRRDQEVPCRGFESATLQIWVLKHGNGTRP